MEDKANSELKMRVSLCAQDAARASALRGRLESAGAITVLDPVWDHPEIAWAADLLLVASDDSALLQKISALEFCPAILWEKGKEDVFDASMTALGRAPFACIESGTSAERLADLARLAANHTQMAWAQGHTDRKQDAMTGEPVMGLEALTQFLKRKQSGEEWMEVLGEMFTRWLGASQVLMLGAPVSSPEELRIQYVSTSSTMDATRWTWQRSEPWIKDLERHNGVVRKETASPGLLRWMRALQVSCMAPLRHAGGLLGILAFAEKPGAPFESKEIQAINNMITRMGQVLSAAAAMAEQKARQVPELVWNETQPATAPAPPKETLRKQQLEIIGRMAMRSSHELKNCLVSIRTFTQLFPEKYADEQFRKDFYSVVSKEVERLNGLVEKLLFFAQPVQLKLTQEKVTDLISEAFTLFAPEDLQNVQLHKVFSHKQPTLWLDRQQMLAVFFHVIQNGLQALSGTGKLVVVTEDHPHPDYADGVLVLRFLDTGRGVALKDKEEAFEPFFSTKARGIGLGLTIAKRIVEEHGGTIRLESNKDKGTEVILCLPRKIPRWETEATAQNPAEAHQA